VYRTAVVRHQQPYLLEQGGQLPNRQASDHVDDRTFHRTHQRHLTLGFHIPDEDDAEPKGLNLAALTGEIRHLPLRGRRGQSKAPDQIKIILNFVAFTKRLVVDYATGQETPPFAIIAHTIGDARQPHRCVERLGGIGDDRDVAPQRTKLARHAKRLPPPGSRAIQGNPHDRIQGGWPSNTSATAGWARNVIVLCGRARRNATTVGIVRRVSPSRSVRMKAIFGAVR
jgi:hypothetical protein